jgi:RNase P subunit RPR2
MESLLDKLLAELKALGMAGIRSYLWGDPITYPTFDLPAIAVSPERETREAFTMAKDKQKLKVVVTIVVNARNGFNTTTREAPADRALIRYAQQVQDMMRANITLDGTVATCKGCGVQYIPGLRQKELLRIAQVSAEYELNASRV